MPRKEADLNVNRGQQVQVRQGVTNTFASPIFATRFADTSSGDQLVEVGRALGQLSPSLSNLGSTILADNRDQKYRDDRSAFEDARRQTQLLEADALRKDYNTLVREGKIQPSDNPFWRIGFDQTRAEVEVRDFHTQSWNEYLNSELRDENDVNKVRDFFIQKSKDFTNGEESTVYHDTFNDNLGPVIDALTRGANQQIGQRLEQEFVENAADRTRDIFMSYDLTTADGQKAAAADLTNYAREQVKNSVHGGQMNQIIIDRAREIARSTGNAGAFFSVLRDVKTGTGDLLSIARRVPGLDQIVANEVIKANSDKEARVFSTVLTDLRRKADAGVLSDDEVDATMERYSDFMSPEKADSLKRMNEASRYQRVRDSHDQAIESDFTALQSRAVADRLEGLTDLNSLGVSTLPDEITLTSRVDPTKTKTIKGDELNQLAIDSMYRDASQSGNSDPVLEVGKVLNRNGLEYKRWSKLLEQGVNSASVDVISELQVDAFGQLSPNDASPVVAGYQLFKKLDAISPRIALEHMNEREHRFYKTAQMYQKFGPEGQDERQALLAAVRADDAVRSGVGFSTRMNFEAVDSSIKELSKIPKSGWMLTPWEDRDTVENVGEIRGIVEGVTQMFMASGLDADSATAAATESIKERITYVNGWAMVLDQSVPPDFSETAEKKLAEYATENDIDADDLTLMKLPSGDAFVIRYKDPTLGLVDNWQTSGIIPKSAFIKEAEEKRSKELEKIKQTRLWSNDQIDALVNGAKSISTGPTKAQVDDAINSLNEVEKKREKLLKDQQPPKRDPFQ